jgi:hypothetical protein
VFRGWGEMTNAWKITGIVVLFIVALLIIWVALAKLGILRMIRKRFFPKKGSNEDEFSNRSQIERQPILTSSERKSKSRYSDV